MDEEQQIKDNEIGNTKIYKISLNNYVNFPFKSLVTGGFNWSPGDGTINGIIPGEDLYQTVYNAVFAGTMGQKDDSIKNIVPVKLVVADVFSFCPVPLYISWINPKNDQWNCDLCNYHKSLETTKSIDKQEKAQKPKAERAMCIVPCFQNHPLKRKVAFDYTSWIQGELYKNYGLIDLEKEMADMKKFDDTKDTVFVPSDSRFKKILTRFGLVVKIPEKIVDSKKYVGYDFYNVAVFITEIKRGFGTLQILDCSKGLEFSIHAVCTNMNSPDAFVGSKDENYKKYVDSMCFVSFRIELYFTFP